MQILPAETVAGFVLAGGQSSRMGTDKALALFTGHAPPRPLIQVALEAFAQAEIPASIAGSRSNLSGFAPEIPDSFPETGPMGGVLSALAANRADWSVFLPVDLPLMPSSLLACLTARARLTGSPLTATTRNGRLEPFPCIVHVSVFPHLLQRLKAGDTACHRAWRAIPPLLKSRLDAVSVESLLQCGHCRHPEGLPPALWYQSANTPDDLAHLNRIARYHFLARQNEILK